MALDYSPPPEPNGERGFKGMIIGVVVGWFCGIVLAVLIWSVVNPKSAVTPVPVGLILAVASAAGGGWIGRQIGLRG